MAEDCLFCKIAAKEIPATVVAEGEDWLAFRDIHPQAPTHILIIPRKHLPSLNEMEDGDRERVGELFLAAKELAEAEGIADAGYRTVINTNAGAGQSVFHVHVHLLGGRALRWPPG